MLRDSIRRIHDVFSRRTATHIYPKEVVSDVVRTKIFLLRDVFENKYHGGELQGNYTEVLWREMHNSLQQLHGRFVLSTQRHPASEVVDASAFFMECRTEHFLDILELVFRLPSFFHVRTDANEIVDAINDIFRYEKVPFQLSPIVTREEEGATPYPLSGIAGRVIHTLEYPKVLRCEDELIHREATVPVLSVLANPGFESANSEFRAAHEDYRKGDFADCVSKCGSAFESVMKVTCERRSWQYHQQETAAPLLRTILSKTSLDQYFEQPLMIIATLRNRTAHGAGVEPQPVRRHVAQFALNATASRDSVGGP